MSQEYDMEPKQYPQTDSSERDARTVLESLLDSRFAKANLEVADSTPHIDGTIELVDENLRPIGKFEVQLRSIPKGQTSYNCEIALPAYSRVSSQALLLVCVDTENKRAYWKHVHTYMPELKGKEAQKSFVVHFSSESDGIDASCIYRHKWMDIARHYQKCIDQFPMVHFELVKHSDMEEIDPVERELFQRFIDTINNLLDNDLAIVKELVFPGVWKLGVGIVSIDQHRYQYQIYRIPYGNPAPLVCKLSRGMLFTGEWSPNAIEETLTSKAHLADPQHAGKEFVLDKLKQVVEAKTLPVLGPHLSSDTLFSFVDRYYPVLGIIPYQDRYSLQDLSHALNAHLLGTAAAVLGKVAPLARSGLMVDLDNLAQSIRPGKVEPTDIGDSTVYFSITSRSFPVTAAFDSLKYLTAAGITEIERSFGRRDLPLSPGKNFIWSGYSTKNEIGSVTRILRHSIEEYTALVEHHHLKLPESPYLDPNTAIIYEYEPAETTPFDGPGLREYFVDNELHRLPKLSVYVRDQQNHHVDATKFPELTIEGNVYTSVSSSSMIASFFFQNIPFLRFIYRMLSQDLSLHYGITLHPF